MLMKVEEEDISKILARADITQSTQRLLAKKQKRSFCTVLGTCKTIIENDCTSIG